MPQWGWHQDSFQDRKWGDNSREGPGTCAQPHTQCRWAPRLDWDTLMPWVQCYRKNGSHTGKCKPFLSALPCPQEGGDGGEREAFRRKGAGTPGNRQHTAAFSSGLSAHTFHLHWACEMDLEHKIRVTQQGHRPAKKWKNFLCWSQAAGDQVFETTLHREFVAGIMDHDKPFIWWDDFIWLLHSEAISISFFLSLGFFSGDIFIAYQMRRKKNK